MSNLVSRPGLDLLIDLGGGVVRREAIEKAIRSGVRSGRLPPSTRLPSTRDLSAQLGVARGTVSAAYAQLVTEGWLQGATGRGTWVAERAGSDRPTSPDELDRTDNNSCKYDFRPGRPDISAFPRDAWGRAVDRVIRHGPSDVFTYGDPRGRMELRTVLAGYLGRVRGVVADPRNIVLCSGYTQALNLLVRVIADLGGRSVAMENPAMADHVTIAGSRLRVVDTPVDQHGMVTDQLTGETDAVICTPAHQFPFGVSMSVRRRDRLLSLARSTGIWIVEDDYDGEFRYDAAPIGALQHGMPQRVCYVGSTSKSLGPAVRVGWIVCPADLLEPVVEAKRLTDRQTSPVDQLALASLITSGGYDRHLRSSRLTYRRRRDALVRAIAARVPEAKLLGISAGLHAVLQPPAGAGTEAELLGRLRARSVAAHPLGDYLRGQRSHPPGLVLGYATPAGHAYRPALQALLDALIPDSGSPDRL